MSWAIGASYVLASILLLASVMSRVDPRLRRILGPDASRPVRSSTRSRSRFVFARIVGRLREGFRAKAEHSRLAGEVPGLLDLLAVSVTAGLSPRLALERAPELVSGGLRATLEVAKREVALGAPWRQALWAAARTSGLDELRRLALTLDRAERLGSPIAERLRDLAVEVRLERRTRREERARRAPVQMLFPLVFLILPAFVLSAVVPALLVATRGVL
jgi:Flp pilus assembly protein TadB